MKLVTYDTGVGPRAGVLDGDRVLDLTVLLDTVAPKRNPDPNYRYHIPAAAPATPGGSR